MCTDARWTAISNGTFHRVQSARSINAKPALSFSLSFCASFSLTDFINEEVLVFKENARQKNRFELFMKLLPRFDGERERGGHPRTLV